MGFHFSASQTETFKDCPRKWGFQKIDKLPSPTHPAAELGSQAHILREEWLLKGVLPSDETLAGRLALAGLDSLPPPGSCEVEKELNLSTPAGPCVGRIDFYIEDQSKAPFPSLSGQTMIEGVPLVGDHKTTSNKMWIKTPEYLSNDDTQAAIYAQYAFENSSSDVVDLFWAYMVKSSPRPSSKSVFTRVHREPTKEKFLSIVEEAQKMNEFFHQDGISANDLPFNPSACSKYGGCPFQSNCKKGVFMPNSNKNGNILGEKKPEGTENSLIQQLASSPPPILVDVAPPDAPSPSYSRSSKQNTPITNLAETEKLVSSLKKIQKEISFIISYFESKKGR